MKNNQKWKKLLALTLCIVQCMVLAVPAVSAQESAPEAMNATSVAVPEPTLSDVPVTVTMKEEGSYWWGNASQATVKLGDPITNISDRYSWIIDSPVEEGYGEKGDGTTDVGQTSNYFEFDAAWAEFDVAKQDLMMYIELPEASSSFRFKHICMNWTWPAPKGMTYEYLAADGRSWARGTIDDNYQVDLPVGFKGYVRVHVDTAANVTDWSGIKSLQYFAVRFDAYGGSYGAAKIGGVWFVDKGEAYQVSVDGGETVALTSATPLPKPGEGGDQAWTGDVLTAHYQNHENGTIGGIPTQVKLEKDQNWWGNPTQVTFNLTEGITSLGETVAYEINSPIGEGFNQPEAKTAPFFNLFGSWIGIDILTQDFMFYIELPEVSNGLRLHGFTATAGSYCWPGVVGMKYQYLSNDSHEWIDGVVLNDGNKTMPLPAGFKGFIRMKLDTVSNFSSLPSTNLSIERLQFYVDRFGGNDGAVKISGVWVASKEDTRYISIDGGDMICMTDAVEPNWIQSTANFKESGNVGDAAVNTIYSDKKWGREPKATMTVGDCINPLNDGQKSIIIDSEQHEGYTLDDPSERTYPSFFFNANTPSVNMGKSQVMIYLELPERASSIRVDCLFFTCAGKSLTPTMGGMKYSYLPIDGGKWIDGGVSDGNYSFALTPGFKGYVRFDMTSAGAWWWDGHDKTDDAWKSSVATFNRIELRYERFGADLGAAKFGGLWVVDKSDFIDISVNGGEAQPMTSYVYVDPVLNAVSTLVEEPETIWIPNASVSNGQVTTENAITKISDCRAVVFNSEAVVNGASVAVDVNAELAENQDVMLYVELAAGSKVLYAPIVAGTSYKYLSVNAGNWTEVASANGQITLPEGFKGYIRLAIAAGNVDTLTFNVDAFGGDKGAFKLGGVWFVSGGDAIYASVDGAEAVALGNMTDAVGQVEQWNVVLQDNIGVNFYIRVDENVRDTAVINTTFAGKTTSAAVANLTPEADGTYKVSVDVAAAQMNENVTIQLISNDIVSTEKSYSVAQYAKAILGASDMGAYYHLVKEMLNYGGAAQVYFGYENPVNADLVGVGANAVPETAETEFSVTGEAEGVKLHGATLVLKNQVAVRYYFQVSGEASAHSFTYNGNPLTPVKSDDLYYVQIDGINPQDLDKAVNVLVDDALTVSYSPMNYMVRMNVKGTENLQNLIKALYNYHLAAKRFVLDLKDPARYDLKVTTFNVGQWYHGTTNLDVYGAQVHTHPGITPAAVENARNLWMEDLPNHDADLIGVQEFRDIFYINNQNTEDTADDVILTADEVLGEYFDIERYTGFANSDHGQFTMWMGMMTAKNGRYQLHNVSGGQLMASNTRYTRAYMKGYITVNGHEIAIYSIHTTNNSEAGDYLTQQFQELIELAKQDEYVIIMGDTNAINGPHEFKTMTDAGFSMANCSKFGSFYTYEYNTDYCIDNIFVTPNIEIVYAECEYEKVGGSDHYPLSAYLVIKDEA